MILFPAIDLYEGKAVRLLRGDYDNMTVYSDAPAEVGKAFASMGAEWIHVVDLEGAKTGATPNFDTVLAIKQESGCKVEIGGGIRDIGTVERYLSAGIDRVILGTAALCDETFLRQAVAKYGEKIAIGADLREGYVAVKGWLETSDTTADAFCERMRQIGVKTLIVTDISRDGAMKGTNRELYRALSGRFDLQITASGGVSDLDDVKALAALGLYGAIIGKAYYTGDIDLKKAVEISR